MVIHCLIRYPVTMKIREQEQIILVRLERGEDVIQSLLQLAAHHNITGAMFHGLGGASAATLGIYRLSEDKAYHYTNFDGDLEIISINGNIATDEAGQHMVHAHATISGNDLQAYGGHVDELIVAGTCEILVDLRTGPLSRKQDDEIGLKLLDLDNESA